MPFSETLMASLITDIESAFPLEGKSPEPRSSLFTLPNNPKAPIIAVSRDSRMGPVIVPHLFFACSPVELLRRLISVFYECSRGELALCHMPKGEQTGGFLMFPFLFDRFPSSSRFISVASEAARAMTGLDFLAAHVIMDCHLFIKAEGQATCGPNAFAERFESFEVIINWGGTCN